MFVWVRAGVTIQGSDSGFHLVYIPSCLRSLAERVVLVGCFEVKARGLYKLSCMVLSVCHSLSVPAFQVCWLTKLGTRFGKNFMEAVLCLNGLSQDNHVHGLVSWFQKTFVSKPPTL